jgi:hypothetical protein
VEAVERPKENNKKTNAAASVKPAVAPVPVAPPPVQPQPAKMTMAPIPAPAPVAAAPKVVTVPVSVADGMPFSVRLTEAVPADAEEGRVLHFAVVDGLKVGDTVVIAKGASVIGMVAEAAGKKKIFGIGGKMTYILTTVDAVDGKKLAIRTEPARGRDKEAAKRPIDSGAKGKTKEVAAGVGSQYVAYIDGNQTVSVKK